MVSIRISAALLICTVGSLHAPARLCRPLLCQVAACWSSNASLSMSSCKNSDFLLKFHMKRIQAEAQLELDLSQGTCALLAETVVKVLTLRQVEDNAQAGKNSTNLSKAMANLVPSYAGGEWSLFFANCQKPSVVSFEMRVEMYNMHNGQKDYLSIGEDMIPAVYLVRSNWLCSAITLSFVGVL